VVEPHALHLADTDAVELHRRTRTQPGYGTVEHDLIARSAAARSRPLQPPDEPEAAQHHRQGKHADQIIIGPRFHPHPPPAIRLMRLRRSATAPATRENRRAATDALLQASIR